MRVLLFLKISILVLALGGVLYAMSHMNSGSMNKAFLALGIEPGTAQSPGFQPANRYAGDGEKRFNLCPTRVHAIVWSDGRKVEESKDGLKLRWMAYDPQPREISYLDVEKWLSAHCQVHVSPPSVEDKTRSEFHDFLTVRYIDGQELKVLRAGEPGGAEDLFRIGDQLYRSDDFRDAVNELSRIALFNPDSTGKSVSTK